MSTKQVSVVFKSCLRALNAPEVKEKKGFNKLKKVKTSDKTKKVAGKVSSKTRKIPLKNAAFWGRIGHDMLS